LRQLETVPTPEEALRRLGLPADRRVCDLEPVYLRAFRQLIGWDPGGCVVEYPTAPEREARQRREAWKGERAGRGPTSPCLVLRRESFDTFRANTGRDAATRRWRERLVQRADQVADLPPGLLERIIPAHGPWNVAGSFCPHCVGDKSDYTIHHPFWRWNPLDPERIQCPHCGIVYPHPDYPEEGRLDLPRLGLSYDFYLSPDELESSDWREGRHASSFGGAPTHVSLSGEVGRCALSWALGQVEPLGVAYALTGGERYARAAAAILERLAAVYGQYPVYSYRQEYSDAEPAYAVDQVNCLPTPYKRAAFHYTYCGTWGDRQDLHGKEATTALTSAYPNGEWGTSRLGREKASNGQLFMSLFKGYDLVRSALSQEECTRIEADFLLELYLDTKGLSCRCDNKAGPGAAARVAVGVFYDDDEELEAGLDRFHQVLQGQFYGDGTWKETPTYGAKSLVEGMAEIPELVRDKHDLYADPLYSNALATYARVGTPADTQPALGDSPVDYCVQAYLGDLARIRLGLDVPAGPDRMEGLGLVRPERVASSSAYAPGLESVAPTTAGDRPVGDGPVGFSPMGHIRRRASRPSALGMFLGPRPPGAAPVRAALNHYFAGRGLACLGWGAGERAVQLYLNADDGRTGHRHADPLSVTLFAGGREVLPDLGYIADHPANAWVRSTASHNTVVVDGSSVRASGPGLLLGWDKGEAWRFCDAVTPVVAPEGDRALDRYRRAVLLLRLPGEAVVLVDLFDVAGGSVHDYVVRVNDAERHFEVPGLAFSPRREPLFQETATPPHDFLTAGTGKAPLVARWGRAFEVSAHIPAPCDEVIRFQSPAWRNALETFEDRQRSWDTLCLRRAGGASRFAAVYEVAPDGHRQLSEVAVKALQPALELELRTRSGVWAIELGDGTCRVERD